jgi:hypothetical protein
MTVAGGYSSIVEASILGPETPLQRVRRVSGRACHRAEPLNDKQKPAGHLVMNGNVRVRALAWGGVGISPGRVKR